MKKELPKYYVIKNNNSQLWKNYADWVKKNGASFRVNDWDYVGFDGNRFDGGFAGSESLKYFQNPVETITLDHWNECVNGIITKQLTGLNQRKIVGYKAPFDLSGGFKNGLELAVKKGDIYVKSEGNSCLYIPKISYDPYLSVPKEIVEKWEAVYEEEKLEVKEWSSHTIIFEGKPLTQQHIDKIKDLLTNNNL